MVMRFLLEGENGVECSHRCRDRLLNNKEIKLYVRVVEEESSRES
jgi:hypothetical protein